MSRHPLGLALAALALTFTAACGGSDRPSQESVAEALVTESGDVLNEAQADCLATVLVESDVADETLQAIIDSDQDYEPSDDEQAVLDDLNATAESDCGDVE